MTSNLPVPYTGGGRALARAERAGLLDQHRAIIQGRVEAIGERSAFGDAHRRVASGYDLYTYIARRTTRLYADVQSVPDDDLRDLLTAGLGDIFTAAVERTRSYMSGR
jgi:hypothetical protein